ncbi:hypothetical protein MMC29_002851 [Sticta canariensis]|nr:hypothetical protein [Sticta canariensis]
MDYRAYADMAPDIGLDSQQIRVLSEQGRARIAAKNAAKEVKHKERQEERMRQKGWIGTIENGLELLMGMVRNEGAGKDKWEKKKGKGWGKREYGQMG